MVATNTKLTRTKPAQGASLTKQGHNPYRDGSIRASLFGILSGGKKMSLNDLAKLAGKGKSISGPLARLERHGKTGKKLARWTIVRDGQSVQLVMKSNTSRKTRKTVASATAISHSKATLATTPTKGA